jgi:hypothetical protein
MPPRTRGHASPCCCSTDRPDHGRGLGAANAPRVGHIARGVSDRLVNDNTKLKTELLKKVMPAFALDVALKSSLGIGEDGEGKDDVLCKDTNLRSRFHFLPV